MMVGWNPEKDNTKLTLCFKNHLWFFFLYYPHKKFLICKNLNEMTLTNPTGEKLKSRTYYEYATLYFSHFTCITLYLLFIASLLLFVSIFSILFFLDINVLPTITGSWSASTSPARSPSPSRYGGHTRRPELPYPTYGTTSLCQRSRSPSPARLQEMRERDRLGYGIDMGTFSLTHTNTHAKHTNTVTHNLHAKSFSMSPQ